MFYVFFWSISVIVVLMILFLLTILLYPKLDILREEFTSYECGFEHHSLSRVPLSIRYFLLTLVFLVFDMEIVLLLLSPMSLLQGISFSWTIIMVMFFVLLLFLGLIYEWMDGSLDWVM